MAEAVAGHPGSHTADRANHNEGRDNPPRRDQTYIQIGPDIRQRPWQFAELRRAHRSREQDQKNDTPAGGRGLVQKTLVAPLRAKHRFGETFDVRVHRK